jgi:hypothetical protein
MQIGCDGIPLAETRFGKGWDHPPTVYPDGIAGSIRVKLPRARTSCDSSTSSPIQEGCRDDLPHRDSAPPAHFTAEGAETIAVCLAARARARGEMKKDGGKRLSRRKRALATVLFISP